MIQLQADSSKWRILIVFVFRLKIVTSTRPTGLKVYIIICQAIISQILAFDLI